MGPNAMTGILKKKQRQRHTRRKQPCVKGDTDWSHVAKNPSMPRNARNHQKLAERYERDSPSGLPEGTSYANTLISDFHPPEL